MKKTFLLMSGLFLTVSSHAQILDVLKSTVKNSTGVDIDKITSQTAVRRAQQLPERWAA